MVRTPAGVINIVILTMIGFVFAESLVSDFIVPYFFKAKDPRLIVELVHYLPYKIPVNGKFITKNEFMVYLKIFLLLTEPLGGHEHDSRVLFDFPMEFFYYNPDILGMGSAGLEFLESNYPKT